MRTLAMLVLVGSAAWAQRVIPAARLSQELKNFDPAADDRPLRCDVSPLRPVLNFSFRFQAGYVLRVPMSQFRGSGHGWAILMRITPENGVPVYMISRMRLPDVPETKVEMEMGGGFLLGEGRYAVAWKMFDDAGRVCRKHWNVDARRGFAYRNVKLAIEPETVTAFAAVGGPTRRARTDDAPPFRLTVLLDAAPTSPRRVRLGARDAVVLLGTLSSLLERLPARPVRLVVFNLDQQKEIYRQDDFQPDRIGQVARALETLQLGTLDYHILQNRRGDAGLLADLVNRELAAEQTPDVVVFLGPLARQTDRFPEELLPPRQPPPRFFYLQYRPPLQRMQAVLPDLIQSAVAKLKGKTVVMHSPADFEKGIQEIERNVR